jgi:HD superfamily phosphodiesterase
MDVYAAAERIAKEEGLQDEEIQILLIAVLFHDSGFMLDRVDHESLSCKIASENLPGFGFSIKQIDAILSLIMATKIPQNPGNLLEEVICDADLDYLGREDFWEIGDKLFEELKALGLISTQYEWNQKQLVFLENHSYFTNSSQKLRNEKKLQNLLEIKARLSK